MGKGGEGKRVGFLVSFRYVKTCVCDPRYTCPSGIDGGSILIQNRSNEGLGLPYSISRIEIFHLSDISCGNDATEATNAVMKK